MVTAAGPVPVIHIDGDDESDEVDEAVQLTDESPQVGLMVTVHTYTVLVSVCVYVMFK